MPKQATCAKKWQADREAEEMAKLAQLKSDLQRLQIREDLRDDREGLLLYLIKRGVV